MSDLFQVTQTKSDYSAKDIEVLEGLEPVRQRPGMYIGGTDERALHHLVAEILDNSMDEAVAGHASRIIVSLHEDGSVSISDNGRGIPIDAFQKTKKSSENYYEMPKTIKKIIGFFYSEDFLKVLEKKFDLRNVEADWGLHGGGMHESFKGGFLKVHSDFLYKRKSKRKRVLNILLYLNSNWQKNWGGSIELWDKDMRFVKKSVLPELNNAVIFRTDTISNHGFPDPINCPENVSRKSIALYYYARKLMPMFLFLGMPWMLWQSFLIQTYILMVVLKNPGPS